MKNDALVEALRSLADEWEAQADKVRTHSRPYDGGGWDMKADAYDACAEDLREAIAAADLMGPMVEEQRPCPTCGSYTCTLEYHRPTPPPEVEAVPDLVVAVGALGLAIEARDWERARAAFEDTRDAIMDRFRARLTPQEDGSTVVGRFRYERGKDAEFFPPDRTPPEDEGELLPCPFCGRSDHLQQYHEMVTPATHFIYCTSCEAAGPESTTYDGCRAAWNRRSRLSTERPEPDGWITKDDVERVRDPHRWPQVPNINVWAEPDEGDLPVFIGQLPRGEATEG